MKFSTVFPFYIHKKQSFTAHFLMLLLLIASVVFGEVFAQTRIMAVSNRTANSTITTGESSLPDLANRLMAVPIDEGYRDFNYGSSVISAPTGEKPESKLWYNNGYWWGSLWDAGNDEYRIFRFDPASQDWFNTGVAIDDRSGSLGDALWDGQKLYVASHIFVNSGSTTTSDNLKARLYRYSFDPGTNTYSLDSGFPVIINNARSETLVLDKDSFGKLWISYMVGGTVMINHSTTDDRTWGTPFDLPSQPGSASSDDICSIQSFGGNKMGVMWSDQNDERMYFSVHVDGDDDDEWGPAETALSGNNMADDHINQLACDDNGNLYAAVKTSVSNSSDPLIVLLKRNASGSWSHTTIAEKRYNQSRPIILVDVDSDLLYVFMSRLTRPRSIYMKTTDLNGDLEFDLGIGTLFIGDDSFDNINNATSTKQCITSETGILVAASEETANYYFHNYIPPTAVGDPPVISSFSPTSGNVGASVTILGNFFDNASNVSFNGVSANFSINSTNEIVATVPNGATTGKISVTNSSGTTQTGGNFTVIVPQFDLTVSTSGNGSVSPSSGTFNQNTVVQLTASPDPGWQFSGWSGDLSGNQNPASVTMDSDKNITATFVESTVQQYNLITNVSGNGSIQMNPAGGIYNENTVVQVTAIPDAGWQFSGWSGDLSGAANPESISMNSNKNITATFSPITSGGGEIVHQNTVTGTSTGGSSVTTSQSPGTQGGTFIAAITGKPHRTVASVNGLGLSWTLVDEQCAGRSQTGVSVWIANGTPTSAGNVTATFSDAPSGAAIIVSRYTGVDVANPVANTITGNTNGIGGNCSGGTDNSNYNFPMFANSGSTIFSAVAKRNKTHTPGSGFDQLSEVTAGSGGSAAGLNVQEKPISISGSQSVDGTFSSDVDWAVVAVALRSGGGGGGGTTQFTLATNTVGNGSVQLSPSGGVYDENTVVQLTATPQPGWEFAGWSGDLVSTDNPASITMDGNKNVTATFTEIVVPQYTLATSVSGNGQILLNPAGGVYDENTEVTVSAVADPGWFFAGWSGDLNGLTNPESITMNSNKNVTALFMPSSGGGGQVAFEEIVSGGSSGSNTVSTTGGIAAVNGDVYLAAITYKKNVTVSGVSGLGLTWQLVDEQCAGRSQTGVSVWIGQGAPTGNGNVTATLGDTPDNAFISVARYSGVDLANPLGNTLGGNTNGLGGNCDGGTDNASYSFAMNTVGSGSTVFSAVAIRNKNHEPGTGFTERIEGSAGSGGSTAGLAVQDQSITVAENVNVSGQISRDVDWAVVAVELRAGSSTTIAFEPSEFGAVFAASGIASAKNADGESMIEYQQLRFEAPAQSGRVQKAVLQLQLNESVSEHLTAFVNSDFAMKQIAKSGSATAGQQIQLDVTQAFHDGQINEFLLNIPANAVARSGANAPKLQLTITKTGNGIDDNGAALVADQLPQQFELAQNYPNPFNPQTTIAYALPQSVPVKITVYDATGRLVTTLADGVQQAGEHRIIFDASRYASGVYFYTLHAGNFRQTRKMMLVK
ncbi:MAG: T9SS type A sorting domain-containing protein [Calditrichae bacterium]|nr:T9SS type A sorting domain-containing protein [Calditrichia bacterium]